MQQDEEVWEMLQQLEEDPIFIKNNNNWHQRPTDLWMLLDFDV